MYLWRVLVVGVLFVTTLFSCTKSKKDTLLFLKDHNSLRKIFLEVDTVAYKIDTSYMDFWYYKSKQDTSQIRLQFKREMFDFTRKAIKINYQKKGIKTYDSENFYRQIFYYDDRVNIIYTIKYKEKEYECIQLSVLINTGNLMNTINRFDNIAHSVYKLNND